MAQLWNVSAKTVKVEGETHITDLVWHTSLEGLDPIILVNVCAVTSA
jgi:hypothetical protein